MNSNCNKTQINYTLNLLHNKHTDVIIILSFFAITLIISNLHIALEPYYHRGDFLLTYEPYINRKFDLNDWAFLFL